MSQVSLYTLLNNVILVVTLLSIVYSDSCDIGFGGYIVDVNGER
jgi:hypothetical protein